MCLKKEKRCSFELYIHPEKNVSWFKPQGYIAFTLSNKSSIVEHKRLLQKTFKNPTDTKLRPLVWLPWDLSCLVDLAMQRSNSRAIERCYGSTNTMMASQKRMTKHLNCLFERHDFQDN